MRVHIALLCLVFIASCTGGPKPYDLYVGTDGVLISFSNNAPPATILEDRAFPVKFELHNAGANTVSYEKLLITFNYDPLYITGGISPYDPGKYDIEQKNAQVKQILGRGDFYSQGERKIYDIPTDGAFIAKPVPGQREEPQTDLTASVCYAYRTFASVSVCIDTNIYQQNEREQTCKEESISLSGGQGAPIAITQVDVQSLPVIQNGVEVIKPQFTIHIQDVGKGYLVGPDSLDMQSACVLKSIPKEQVNTVRVEARLLKTKLQCGKSINELSGLVKLEQGKGEIICTVAENDLSDPVFSATQNFQTVLTINASYLYKMSTTKKIAIQRVLGRTTEDPLTLNTKVSGYAYSGDKLILDDLDRPMTQCAYLQANPTQAPKILQDRIADLAPKKLSCACGQQRCLQLGRNFSCFEGLCPGDTYCCTDLPPPPPTEGSSHSITGGELAKDFVPEETLSIPSTQPPANGTRVPHISKQQYNDLLEAAAAHYGIPEDVLKAVAYQESKWNNTLIGDGGKSYGTMQIHTRWHEHYDIERGKLDPSYNIQYGAQYLASLKRSNEESWFWALARYNGGSNPNDKARAYATKVLEHAKNKPWIKQWNIK
jgi:hypothetical protein